MGLVVIQNLSGIPPYQVYTCDIYQFNCVYTTTIEGYVPPEVTVYLPSEFSTAPQALIKIIDSTGCVFTQTYMCLTPTPTPSITPSITPTTSLTPSITPTTSLTPSITPTTSLTPSITPTPTITPSITPTNTITPSPTVTPTPSLTPEVPFAYLFIEPYSGSSSIGSYMHSQGSSFYGFTNSSQPSSSASTFQTDMSTYVNFSGWSNGEFPKIIKASYAYILNNNNNFDQFGNPIIQYNFITTEVPEDYVLDKAWYTWIIPTGYTNNQYQSEIDLGIVNPNVFTSYKMNSSIYNNSFNYVGPTIGNTTYRVYTTFPNAAFELDNNVPLYFRGSLVD